MIKALILAALLPALITCLGNGEDGDQCMGVSNGFRWRKDCASSCVCVVQDQNRANCVAKTKLSAGSAAAQKIGQGKGEENDQCMGPTWSKKCLPVNSCIVGNNADRGDCLSNFKIKKGTAGAPSSGGNGGSSGGNGGSSGGNGGSSGGNGGSGGSRGKKSPFGNKFAYGIDYKDDNTDYSAYDYLTIWIGSPKDGCKGRAECTDFNNWWHGSMCRKAVALNKIPVFYGYIIAFEARNYADLQDCDVRNWGNLCSDGADWIRNNRQLIVDKYRHYAVEIAKQIGRDRTCVFLMEPDFWQYYGHQTKNTPLTGPYARALWDDMVKAIKENLPNAYISWDISAWIGQQGFEAWWSNFETSPYIDFIHTSGGQARGDTPTIKTNELEWAWVSRKTGRKIIGDCGYGVAGGESNNRQPWYNQGTVDARMRDGVISSTMTYGYRDGQKPWYKPDIN